MKRRDFCKAAALLAAGALVPHADAAQPDTVQAIVGSAAAEDRYTVNFRSDLSEADLPCSFYYTDAFFEHSALEYHHPLAQATLCLAVCGGSTWQSEQRYWMQGEVGREDSIEAAYRQLGFANTHYVGYDRSLNEMVDTAGCAFAQKTLVHGGRRTTLVAAMLRGFGYGNEWASNLHVGAGGGHAAFISAAEQFFADLQSYLALAKKQAGTLGTVKLWIGGYSRGSAAANLAAA